MLNINTLNLISLCFLMMNAKTRDGEKLKIIEKIEMKIYLKMEKELKDNKLFNTISLEV